MLDVYSAGGNRGRHYYGDRGSYGGGGSGGRVALHVTSSVADGVTLSAEGGQAANTAAQGGAPGLVYTSAAGVRSLVIDNGAISASQAGAVTLAAQVVPLPAPASLYSQYASTIAGWASGKQFTTLCYSKQQHGASSSAFHSRCDGRGASLTIMRLSTGKIIGGYTSASWSSSSSYYNDSNAFLFSITNSFKHTLRSCSNVMYRHASYGPTFGGGHDLRIDSNMNGGYCNLGHTYNCRTGSYGSTTCRNDFCGSYNGWTVAEFEVWVGVSASALPPPPPPRPAQLAQGISCTDTCARASDGVCDDGGPGSESWYCALGTDCTDCGYRVSTPPVELEQLRIVSSQVVWSPSSGLTCHNASLLSSIVEAREPLNISTLALSSSTVNINVNGSSAALRVPSSLTLSSSSTLITSSVAAGTLDIDATSVLRSAGTTTGDLRVEAQQLTASGRIQTGELTLAVARAELSAAARITTPISLLLTSDEVIVAGIVTAGSSQVFAGSLVVSGSMTSTSSLEASGSTLTLTGQMGCTALGCVTHLNFTEKVSLSSMGTAIGNVVRVATPEMHLSGSAAVNASGRGAAAAAGTSPGGTASTSGGGGAGGGHGGDGGQGQSNSISGRTYGDMLWPATSGSGGGAGNYQYSSTSYKTDGGGGGGVIHLNVSGTLRVESGASITSNGAAGGHGFRTSSSSSSYYYRPYAGGGGGSGGSVLIVAESVLGSGLIKASGGCVPLLLWPLRSLPSRCRSPCFYACPALACSTDAAPCSSVSSLCLLCVSGLLWPPSSDA